MYTAFNIVTFFYDLVYFFNSYFSNNLELCIAFLAVIVKKIMVKLKILNIELSNIKETEHQPN